MTYRAEIDGLRALAVLPVIFFHAGFAWFSGGFVGVDVFFVISGYLITSILLTELDEGTFSLINFYERRARRILPALFFVVAVCVPFAWMLLSPADLKDFGQSLIAVATFSSNILFWRESGYFATAAELKPLLHTWSLAVEEQYYIVFPVLLAVIWRWGVKWTIVLLSLIFVVSLGVAQWGSLYKPLASFYLLPTRMWELLIGVFAALYSRHAPFQIPHLANQALSMAGLMLILYSIAFFDEATPFPGVYALVPTLGTALLILCAQPKTLAHSVLSLKPLVGLGLLSYSAYLWHQPILAFARHRMSEEVPDAVLLTLCFAVLPTAWFSWRYIEKPFRNKEKVGRNAVFQLSFTAILVSIGTGAYLHFSDGRINSYPEDERAIHANFIDPEEYLEAQHARIVLKDFDKGNSQKDILIIGDSHSQDLVNAVYEAGLDEKYEFSAHFIDFNCGVLFIEKSRLEQYQRSGCAAPSPLDDKALQSRMTDADEIWVVSSWQEYTMPFMEESLRNIRSINSNLVIFSNKYFGDITSGSYKNTVPQSWLRNARTPLETQDIKAVALRNDAIESIVIRNNARYINVQKLLCNGEKSCPNYDGNNILSYDGSHLTEYGAKSLGMKLKEHLGSL